MKVAIFIGALLALLASAAAQTWTLEFTGTARDVGPSFVRQIAEGTLAIYETGANGTKTLVDEFVAHSGAMGNGALPNGDWTATAPINSANQFRDETGKYGYKMPLSAPKSVLGNRYAFLIHSTMPTNNKMYVNPRGWTEGCIGTSGGHEENVRFYDLMLGYFKKNKSIKVKVDIEGNANVNVQLGEKDTYHGFTPYKAPVKPAPKRTPVRRS